MSSHISHHSSSIKNYDLHFLTQLSSSSNPSTPIPQTIDPSGSLTPDTAVSGNPFASISSTNNNLSIVNNQTSIRIIGQYELNEVKFDDFKCARHIPSGETLLYKEYPLELVRQRLEPYQRLTKILLTYNTTKQIINTMSIQQLAIKYNLHFFCDVLSLDRTAIVLYPNYSSNLHTYITEKHRLSENKSKNFFTQIVKAVKLCHQVGLIIRDLKLRKIIFNNTTHTQILLSGLDSAIMLPTPTTINDFVSSRFSCPVYACPEIVLNRQMYSGKFADSWCLGKFRFLCVFPILYTCVIKIRNVNVSIQNEFQSIELINN